MNALLQIFRASNSKKISRNFGLVECVKWNCCRKLLLWDCTFCKYATFSEKLVSLLLLRTRARACVCVCVCVCLKGQEMLIFFENDHFTYVLNEWSLKSLKWFVMFTQQKVSLFKRPLVQQLHTWLSQQIKVFGKFPVFNIYEHGLISNVRNQFILTKIVNPFQANIPFLLPLRTLEMGQKWGIEIQHWLGLG